MLAVLAALILLKVITSQAKCIRWHVTPRIVHHVQRQLWLLKVLQSFRSPALTEAVTMSANTVCVEFFAVSLPVLAWCACSHFAAACICFASRSGMGKRSSPRRTGFPEVAWPMVIFMAIHNYLCLFMKVGHPFRPLIHFCSAAEHILASTACYNLRFVSLNL